jgi:hypothetical protein
MSLPSRATLLLILFGQFAHGANLTSMGDWVETITATNLVAGAGSNLQPQFESISGVTILAISNAPGPWTLRARLSGTGGHGDVSVQVKRTSTGGGAGSIDGGTAYIELSGLDSEIFSGTESRESISLQFKLTGLSCRVSPDTYLSSIIFTVQ